jgi:hypothetical protein
MGRQNDMLSDAIMIIPSGSPSPKYRDDANGPFWILTILREMTISPSLQVPQLVLPSKFPPQRIVLTASALTL